MYCLKIQFVCFSSSSSFFPFSFNMYFALSSFFSTFPICADLLDELPGKRKPEDGGYLSDEGPEVLMTNLSLKLT